MDILDTIKKFQQVGFTNSQAEVQVKTMSDIKKGLATQEDIAKLQTSTHNDMIELQTEVQFRVQNLSDRVDDKFKNLETRVDARFDKLESKMDAKFLVVDARLEALNQTMNLMPLRMTGYFIGVVIAGLTLYSFWPIISVWLRPLR